jgi:hypothetical protein
MAIKEMARYEGAVKLKGRYVGESDNLGCINGKIYDIVAIQSWWKPKDKYAVIDETGEAYIYPVDQFEIIEE